MRSLSSLSLSLQRGWPSLSSCRPPLTSAPSPSLTLLRFSHSSLSRSFTQHLAYANDEPTNTRLQPFSLPSPFSPPAPSPLIPIPSPSPLPPPHTWTTTLPDPFPLSLHSTPLPSLTINWSLIGNPTGPTIFILPSMSHSSLVSRPHPQPSIPPSQPGWWESVVGHGLTYGIDLNVFNVLSASALGAPFGTTSPLSVNPGGEAAYRSAFPLITPLDQARCHERLLRYVTEGRGVLPSGYRVELPLYAVVGSSMGGMAAIHFATHFPSLYRRVIIICTTPLTSPSTQALRSTQRAAVRMDPLYKGGYYTDPPLQGLRLARMMGTICYRSRVEFDQRFSPLIGEGGRFPVERYLDHVGWAFGGKYDANCYLLLSECMDRMDVGQRGDGKGRVGYEEAVRRVNRDSEWMVLPVTEDALIPAEESDRWASALGAAGVKVHHERISSKFGHDAFLKEGEKLNPRIAAFLTGGRTETSGVESVRKFVNELYGA